MRSFEGRENKGKKMISGQRNKDTHPKYYGGYKIQRDSIHKIGTKISKRKKIGKRQISHNGVLEIHPFGDGAISSLRTQHQGPRGQM